MDYITDERFDKLYKKRNNNVKDTKKFYYLYRRLVRSFAWDDLEAFNSVEKDIDKAIKKERKTN